MLQLNDEGLMTAVFIVANGVDFCNQVQLRKVRKEGEILHSEKIALKVLHADMALGVQGLGSS